MPLRRWVFIAASVAILCFAILAVASPAGRAIYFWWTIPPFPKVVGPITPDSPIGIAIGKAFAAEKAKDYQKAIDIYSAYLDQEPERGWYTITVLHKRAADYERLKQYDRAEADLTAAINVTPYAVLSYVDRGDFYMRRRRDQEAIADFRKGGELNRRSGLYAQKEAALHEARGEYQRAIERYSEAIRIEPANRSYFFERGSAYNYAKMYGEARADFDKALAIADPKAKPRETVRPNMGRGFAELQLGQYQEAIDDFDVVLKVVPRASNVLAWRGSAHQMLGHRELAIADFKAALAIDPQHKGAIEKLKELEPPPL